MADPLDYERQREPTPRTTDWASLGAVAYVAVIVIAMLLFAFAVWFLKSIQSD